MEQPIFSPSDRCSRAPRPLSSSSPPLTLAEGEDDGELVAGGAELTGDDDPDIVTAHPWNENEPSPGLVLIEWGGSGQTTMLQGKEDDDRFGESVNPTTDVNGDGYADVIVGAPGEGPATVRRSDCR